MISNTLARQEVGYDIPASIGMAESEIQTPCLLIDLDAFEKNVRALQRYCDEQSIKLRVHGKMHKSAAVAHYQIEQGAVGICCQKVSEAEAFARDGIKDILISNQVRDPLRLDRLARLPLLGARIGVCVDDLENIAELSAAAVKQRTLLDVLVEMDCGWNRCGVGLDGVVALAQAIEQADNLAFAGIQGYHGTVQHVQSYQERQKIVAVAANMMRAAIGLLADAGLKCAVVTGGGTGSYAFETASGVYTELQCGSYAFMDADYQRIHNEQGQPIQTFDNALFILTSIMSHVKADKAICDAGLKVQSLDSGLPYVFGRDDVRYIQCSDEHGEISDPSNALKINERLRLVPGHCDPTCNLHDWYVGVRNGRVECLWPISARGKAF